MLVSIVAKYSEVMNPGVNEVHPGPFNGVDWESLLWPKVMFDFADASVFPPRRYPLFDVEEVS